LQRADVLTTEFRSIANHDCFFCGCLQLIACTFKTKQMIDFLKVAAMVTNVLLLV
jgi:hypothetical protein